MTSEKSESSDQKEALITYLSFRKIKLDIIEKL